MRKEIHTKTVPVYQKYYDEQGELVNIVQTGEVTETVTELFADKGKQFVRISDGQIVGERITLGTEDCAENYTEV